MVSKWAEKSRVLNFHSSVLLLCGPQNAAGWPLLIYRLNLPCFLCSPHLKEQLKANLPSCFSLFTSPRFPSQCVLQTKKDGRMHTQINVKTASNEKCSLLSDGYFCLSDSIHSHTSNGTLQKMLMLGVKSQADVKDMTTTKQNSSAHRVLCGTSKIHVFERLRSVRIFKLLRASRFTQLCASGHAADIEGFPVSGRTFLVQTNECADAAHAA